MRCVFQQTANEKEEAIYKVLYIVARLESKRLLARSAAREMYRYK
jgi:hypothetical protein